MSAITSFLKLMMTNLFIAHWIACFFYYVGDYELGSSGRGWIISAGI